MEGLGKKQGGTAPGGGRLWELRYYLNFITLNKIFIYYNNDIISLF